MAQDEWPEPFGAPPGTRALMLTLRDDAPGYELTEGAAVVGLLLGTGSPLSARAATGEWTFALHRDRRSWWAAAVRRGATRAAAAFYPGRLPGGQIATDDRAYALRHEPLRWEWRLRDEDGRRILAVRAVRAEPWRRRLERMAVEPTPDLAAAADPAFLVLFASWIVMIHGSTVY
jgi:hypothetical protein